MRFAMRFFAACLFVVGLFCAASAAAARDYHVSVTGRDDADGSAAAPLRTISAAAKLAQPGDTVIIHKGTYRERINPPRGGSSDKACITYRAAEDDKPVISGSEVVTGWKKTDAGLWTVTLPNSFFGDYNPYKDKIHGDWFNARGRVHHTGEVYLDAKTLAEEVSAVKAAARPMSWYCEVDDDKTTLWANFGDANPTRATVEINVRPTCFYSDTPGRSYITLRGLTLCRAATQWAAPTAEQIGLVGTHWSKGWVIEDCVVRDSKCVGITLGKDRASGHNKAQSAGGYNVVVRKALESSGWSKANIGSHTVRRCVIHDCGAAGICGSLGAVFSTITDNHIYRINYQKPFGGAEQAGIKIHASIDTLIRDNHIHHCHRGIWLDWMAQGARVSANLLYENQSEDLFFEVDHGPYLVDNNILLSKTAIREWSEGGAFVHNLIAGAISTRPEGRKTPYHKPHSTEIAGLSSIAGGDDRFINNVFVGKTATTKAYDKAKPPMVLAGNVFVTGAESGTREKNPVIAADFDPAVKILQKSDGFYLQLKLDTAWQAGHDRQLVTSKLLGKARVPGVRFEQPDGSDYRVETDYLGRGRQAANPFPGPLVAPKPGEANWKVWPKASTSPK